jgi:hypothetical protein
MSCCSISPYQYEASHSFTYLEGGATSTIVFNKGWHLRAHDERNGRYFIQEHQSTCCGTNAPLHSVPLTLH